MLQIAIDRKAGIPGYAQIRDAIAGLVDAGVLRPGERLPPTRALCDDLGVHRSTVVRAYEELKSLGYLDSRSGGYTTVRVGRRPPAADAGGALEAAPTLIDWDRMAPASLAGVRGHHPALESARAGSEGMVDLDRLSADPALAPSNVFRRLVRRVLLRSGGAAVDYGDPAGWRPLREVLALRMRGHGVAVTPDEILVTAGAQHGLDLLLRYLTIPGGRGIVEAPTYGLIHSLLRLHRLEPVEVPMSEAGIDLACLREVATASDRPMPKLIYTMPCFQNPTGITTGQLHREELLTHAETHGIPIVEDGYEEEMKYTGLAVMPLKATDRGGVVVYVGTFSKVVFPGLRIGWIAAPRKVIEHLTDVVRSTALSGNTLAQALAAQFCSSGEFEKYLHRIHRIYRHRMQTLLAGLDEHLPETVTFTRPRGGYTTWLTLPPVTVSEGEVVGSLAHAGVKVGGGRRYFGRSPERIHLRLSIACASAEEIARGCSRLGEVLGGITDAGRTHRRGS